MLPKFFINRPIFAWVIALFIVLMGVIAIPQLPIARYPSVAPPSVTIFASYPGASPKAMNQSVLSVIERELSGVKGLLYFDSSADTSGSAQITVTFKPGTDPEMAQIDMQNRIKSVESRLPQSVRQNGLQVESASSNFLMLISMTSDDSAYNEVMLSDYMSRNIVPELRQVNGVGRIQLFGSEQAMRIWIDPSKLMNYQLSVNDISQAIEQQNIQIAPGRLGDEPILSGQRFTVPLTVQGLLSSVDEFKSIILKANANGSKVVLGDVARVEIGAQSYAFSNRENGKPAAIAAIQLASGANAVLAADAIQHRLEELSSSLPKGMKYSIPFNTAPFVKVSISKVIYSLFEAMLLVFAVMYLFLQNFRCTLIPSIVAPIALLGTFALMLIAGLSINVLTMFGMVLAIGIIVDDAIVVVENVERLMATEQLTARDATIKAMKEITGAVIGITLVLTAVFVPIAFSTGSVGVIYKQLAFSMAISILFSAFLALTLTPALCASLLVPSINQEHKKRRFFKIFNRYFDNLTKRYTSRVTQVIQYTGRMMLVFIVICCTLFIAMSQLPSSFLPEEDQGYFMTSIQLPTGATSERTLDTLQFFESHIAKKADVASNIVIQGFSFSGSGANTALAFTTFKNWEKVAGIRTKREMELTQFTMEQSNEGTVMTMMPPAIDELGTSSGFSLYLQDRSNQGEKALLAAQEQLLTLAKNSNIVQDVLADGLPLGESIQLTIDRKKAAAMSVSFNDINTTLSTSIGSLYINDFSNGQYLQQVIVQADAKDRMQLNDVLRLAVRNEKGSMVPLRELVNINWINSPQQVIRFQGLPAVRISGSRSSGVSSGEAMQEIEYLATQLPHGFTISWIGESLQEQQSAQQAPKLIMLSVLVVFLVLAALYESWTIPLSVLLVVPLGLIGATIAIMLRGLPNDVFFKIGIITMIGLSSKNAILIVEFARQLHKEGLNVVDSVITAAKLRFRPILMTSLAFTLGVIPLMMSSGASSETQHAIGTGVFGGMISATLLAIFFVPVFFIFIVKIKSQFGKLKS